MKETIKLSLALAIICLGASAVLAVAQHVTKDAQDAAKIAEMEEAFKEVLPAFDTGNGPLKHVVEIDPDAGGMVKKKGTGLKFYLAISNGKVVACAGEGVTNKGFGGVIRVLVGVNTDGTIRGSKVTQHKETPGLGTQVTDRTKKLTLADLFGKGSNTPAAASVTAHYLDQFVGRSILQQHLFKVVKDGGDIDAVSGATISSRAVADAISRIAQVFADNKNTILAVANSWSEAPGSGENKQ